MADPESKQPEKVRAMFNRIAGTYDLLNRTLSAGVDRLWRRQVAREIRGPNILDLATGTGDVLGTAASFCPASRRVGLDFAEGMLMSAPAKDPEARFVQGDGRRLPFRGQSFDTITCAFGIRNMVPREAALKEAYRVLKPGGRFLILEFFPPSGGVMLKLYRWYLRSLLPVVGNLVSGTTAYGYLQETVEGFCDSEEFLEELRQVGFEPRRNRALTGGVARLVRADRPGQSSSLDTTE